MSCAETAELIDLPFGLWTWVGRRKNKFNPISQRTPMCTISIVFAKWRQCTRRHSAMSAKQFAICIVKSCRPKVAQVQYYSPGGFNVHGRAHWYHLANTIEPSICDGDAVLYHCGFFLLSFFLSFFTSPILSHRRLDVCHTSTHGVALVQI